MKISKKFTLAIAMTLISLIIGTNVSAIDINQRILSNNNLLLGASVDSKFSEGTPTTTEQELDEEQKTWWETWKKGESVEITWEELKKTPELLCIESEAGLPSGKKIKYKKKEGPITFGTGESSYEKKEDYKIAYILSEPTNSDQNEKELYEQDIQGALWRTEFNLDKEQLSEDKLAGKELYNKAEKYADYKYGYLEPQSIDAGEVKTVNNDDNKIVGPLKIKYNMTYVTTGENTTMFGNITNATLKDEEGKEYTHGTDWWIVNENGDEISNTIGTNKYIYPTSEQNFYIKIKEGTHITKANLSFKFNNLTAKAYTMTVEGEYTIPAKTEKTLHLCPDCNEDLKKAMAEVKCGDSLYGSDPYEGYKIKITYENVRCGSKYEINKGDLPEGYTSPLTSWANKNVQVYTAIIVEYNGVEHPVAKTYVRCGGSYTESKYYENALGAVYYTQNTTKTAYCGGTSCTREYASCRTYTFAKCKSNGGKEYCTSCQTAYDELLKNGLRLW